MKGSWTAEELDILAETPLFRGTEPGRLREILTHPLCTRESFPRGAELYTPKQFRRSLGILLRGSLRVSKGRLAVSTLLPGDLFGAASLFHRRDRFESTITAREPCVAAFFPEERMLDLLGHDPALCGRYLAYLSERIHFLSQRVDALAAQGSEGKLARWLWEAGREGTGVVCPAAELARRLDVGRSSLYRAFRQLEEAGLIRREGKRIEVLDRAGLAAFF